MYRNWRFGPENGDGPAGVPSTPKIPDKNRVPVSTSTTRQGVRTRKCMGCDAVFAFGRALDRQFCPACRSLENAEQDPTRNPHHIILQNGASLDPASIVAVVPILNPDRGAERVVIHFQIGDRGCTIRVGTVSGQSAAKLAAEIRYEMEGILRARHIRTMREKPEANRA